MSTENNRKENIKAALAALPNDDFLAATRDLLETLGYRSELAPELRGSVDEVVDDLGVEKRRTRAARNLTENARSVGLIFQVGENEINANGQGAFDWGTGSFERGHTERFNFVAVELRDAGYPRGQYADFTREINAWFNAPTVILFKTANSLLTLAFVHRRVNKRDPDRDVLGSVSLIREINPARPHRAHLDILSELSLDNLLAWMGDHSKPQNFDGLLAAWLATLDIQELNKRFYKELFAWFLRAVDEATFPAQENQVLKPEEHVIRLITRLLFVWFLKEKRLVAGDLFNETKISDLLQDYDRATGDSYYRAVLQNLFFATLNTEIDKRGFSKEKNATHRNFSLYRYKSEICDPKKLLALFSQTPFINGGLFDCLDSEEATTDGGYRIDCFTDNPRQRRDYAIPNRLFFDDSATNPGLVTLFNRYKFTVEENTPVEQEVALDPELLGKVFENLLAAYNPETRDTARKQTGSYYTPRAVVDYMVDEALVASLAQKCQPTDGDTEFWQDRLRYLLDYADAFNDANELFEKNELHGIVRAIAGLKVLDPAVGSGAFPMGVLHKLTLALRRIDPDNTRWEALQKERARAKADAAFETKDQQERDAELLEISETFEKYSGDFGRKLYLIQNSIFGVDIQPIACQIAKLRFFISLAIEQEPDPRAENFGIKPLPNLETRFIAADTLLKLKSERVLTGKEAKKSEYEPMLASSKTQSVERQLLENRERYFHATTRRKKLEYKREDERLREELAKALESLGFPADDAKKIARWDPYTQNACAAWFDAEYMFGVANGFDVVIGNPPYVQLEKNTGKLRKFYKDAGFTTLVSRGDVYQLFYEKGCQLLTPECGLLAYITSNSWLKAEYGKSTRRYFSDRHTPLRLLEMGKDVFENAIVDTSVLILREGTSDETGKAVDMDRLPDKDFPPAESFWGALRPQGEKPWSVLSAVEWSVMDKMEDVGTPLKEWDININYGIKTGYNKAFVINDLTREELVTSDPSSARIIKPILRGQDIRRYQAQWAGLWLIVAKLGSYKTLPKGYPAVYEYLAQHEDKLRARGQCKYSRAGSNNPNADYNGQHHWLELDNNPKDEYLDVFAREKLFWMDMSPEGRFAYSETEMYCNDKGFVMTGRFLKYLCAILNSTLITWFIKNTALTTGAGLTQWKKFTIERLPIPKIFTDKARYDLIVTLVDYIILLKKRPSADGKNLAHARDYLMIKYFEQIIDGLVYELYLPEELHRANKYFFKPLLDEHLPPIKEIDGNEMFVLRRTFERLFGKKHPVRKNLFFLDSLEVIRAVEGKA